jgi:hypothetical protein
VAGETSGGLMVQWNWLLAESSAASRRQCMRAV